MRALSIHPDTRLGPVSLTVSNLARALRFYKDTLGMKTLQRQVGGATLGSDDATPLVAVTEKQDARPKPPRTTGLYHFAILMPNRADLARVLRRMADKTYPLGGASDHGVSEALYLADPDGNGIELYTDRPREAWTWQEDQLQMFTAPLDVDELIRYGDSSWDDLPPGTQIGHVHLQVADLTQAESFYCHVLGFDLMQRYGASALFLSAGGYHHHIGLNIWAGVGAPPPPPDAVGLRHSTIHLPDAAELARVMERLQAAGFPLERQSEAGQKTDTVVLRDPSGNGIHLEIKTP